MADNKINVGGRLHSIATGNVLAGADEILDDSKNKKQSDINTETYNLVNEVNAKLDSLSPEQQSALSVATKANKNEANLGYYVCYTASDNVAKVVFSATGYILAPGGSIKINMTNANTADNATLNINSTGAKPLYYNGERASASNSWEADETVEVYYDGINFYANNITGGGTFSTGEKVKNVGIDSELTAGSENLVKSGAVALGVVYDVSAKNPTAGPNNDGKWESLSALLSDANLNTLIPTSVRKGGMNIKFVQSSDNKYVQCRLITDSWSINTNDWAIAEEGIYVDNPKFVYVKTDAEDKILWAIRTNGDIFYGAGVPSQVVNYINDKIAELPLEEYEYIVTFLNDLEKGDKTLQTLLDEKVNKEERKSLINTDFADGISVVDSSEIVDIKLDAEDHIVELTKKDGTKVLYSGLKVKGNIHSDPVDFEINEDNSFSSVELDKDGRIISAVRKDGKEYFKKKVENYIPQYSKLLDAMRDDCYKPFLLGSQLVQANTSSYDKVLGQQNTFNANKLIKQFNYIGLDGKLPNMKMGRLQKIMIGDVQATILYMGTYIYAVTDGNGIVYRMPYSKLSIITENNTDIDSISISLDNMIIDGVYETNDGNFLIQVYDSTSPDTYPTRSLYKVTLDEELNATVSAEPVIVCVQSTSNIVGVREHWSFKQYGKRILISPYGSGRTGQVWMSEDYGNTFECIFNIADDSTYVATKPNGQGGYGAYGVHPLPSQMLPLQGDDFWNNVSSIGNGSKHIHSLCYDEEFERIWLVMGDDKYLATGIYWSDDMGKTWHRKSLVFHYPDIDCGETTQMLQVVSMKNCVLFGTDGWGNGIFRYNRGKKEDEPILEFVFGWDDDRDNLYGIASHNIVTSDGIMLMVFAANSNAALPRGGVVASDGYHFNKIFTDTYSDGVTLESQKIGWPSFLNVNNDNLYIRTKNKNEIILIEKYNY